MKVLVATARTQGARENDFFHCVEGELVYYCPPCRDSEGDADSECGCSRCFYGLASDQGTTTAQVRELRKFTVEDYVLAMEAGLARLKWGAGSGRAMVSFWSELIESVPAGAIVERRLEDFRVREVQRR
jgi:hypothetical protein